MKAQVLPLPFVPATWITGGQPGRCGLPSKSSRLQQPVQAQVDEAADATQCNRATIGSIRLMRGSAILRYALTQPGCGAAP